MSFDKEWKTVNKGKKTFSNEKLATKKQEKKKFVKSMPRIEPIGPLKESPTIYQRFMEEEMKMINISKKDEDIKAETGIPRKKLKNLNLRDAIDGLDREEFEEVIAKSQKASKNAENVIKDLANYINSQLPNPPNYDPVLSNRPYNYPLCEVSNTVETMLHSYFLHAKSDALVLDCLDHCIDCLLNGFSKGIEQQSMGYRLLIQLMLKKRPQLLTTRLQKYEHLQQKHSSRPLKNLLMMWVFAQAGYASLSHGLKVWFQLMFSQINVKNVNLFVIEFLEKLVRQYPSIPAATKEAVVSKTEYFKFFSEVYSLQSNLSETLKDRLKQLLPFIQRVAWNDGADQMDSFFIGYLSRCVKDCPLEKKIKLLECGTDCLLVSPKSFEAWQNKLAKYSSQTVIFLDHISESSYAKRLLGREGRRKRNGVVQLLPTLRVLKEDKRNDEDSLEDIVASIQIIEKLKKANEGSSFVYFLFFLLLLSPFLLFAVDLYHHQTLQATQTMKLAKQVGADKHLQEVYTVLQHKSIDAYNWVVSNCPESMKHSLEHLSLPSIDTRNVSKWIKSLKLFLLRGVDEFNQRFPILLEYLSKATDHVINVLMLIFRYICDFLAKTHDYLVNKVFVDEWAPEKLHGHLLRATTAVKDNFWHLFTTAKKSLNSYI